MKRKLIAFLIFSLILILLGTTVLTAQTTNVPKPRHIPGTVTNKRPIKYDKGKLGGVFIDSIMGEPKTFNLAQSTDGTSSEVIAMTACGLMDLNYDTGQWEVFLGDHKKGQDMNDGSGKTGYKIDVLKDGKMEITIYLRNGIYWTDGTPMTADDWVYYYNEIECNEDVATMGYGGTLITMPNGDEEQIRAKKIDKLTFKYIFPRTLGDPEIMASGNIMPMHVIKPVMDTKGPDGIKQMWGINTKVKDLIGYGPWIIESFDATQGITFRRNERYFFKDEWNNPLPYLDKFIKTAVADGKIAVLKFKNKQLDTLYVETSDFKELVDASSSSGFSVWNGGTELYKRFIVFNQNPNAERLKGKAKLKWFKDKDFRWAMSMLIDRESLLQQAYNSLGEPADGFIPPASPYYDPKVTFNPEYNPDRAKKLLENSVNVIKDRNGDGIMEDKDGNKIEFELLTNSGYGYKEQTVVLVAKEWTVFGIKTTPVLLEFNVVTDKINKSYDYDSHYMTLGGSIFPIAVNVWPSNGNYHVWYPYQKEPATKWEAKIDKLHNDAMCEADFKKRKALWNEMFKILYEELPLIPIVRKYEFQAFYDKWGNIYWDAFATAGDNLYMRLYKK